MKASWIRILALAAVVAVSDGCVKTTWIEVPHPSQVEAGSHIRVTAGGEPFELMNVFVIDDSLLVGERPSKAPHWAIPPGPVPFSSIERVETVGGKEVQELRTAGAVLAVAAGALVVGFFMLMANAGT